jgi:hypothetical protein
MEEKVGGQKKRRVVNVMQAIEQTLPSASAVKAAIPANTEDAGGAEAEELIATMSEIDKLISYVVAEETGVAAEENMAAVPNKGKKLLILLRERKILTFGTWVARNFLSRIN